MMSINFWCACISCQLCYVIEKISYCDWFTAPPINYFWVAKKRFPSRQARAMTNLTLGDVAINLKVSIFKRIIQNSSMGPHCEISLRQNWLVQGLVWYRQANADPNLSRHMVSLGHNELTDMNKMFVFQVSFCPVTFVPLFMRIKYISVTLFLLSHMLSVTLCIRECIVYFEHVVL